MAQCYADRRNGAASYEGGTMIATRIATAALMACIATAVSARISKSALVPRASSGSRNIEPSRVELQGDALDAAIELDAVLRPVTAPPKALKRVQVKVPVKSLKCGHGGMDNNLYKALKADESRTSATSWPSFEAAPRRHEGTFTLHTIGTLTIAGKENQSDDGRHRDRLPDGSVMAKGLVPIKMTDFGIKPPTAIFGRLKTGNEVKVNFELTIGAKAIAAAAGGER